MPQLETIGRSMVDVSGREPPDWRSFEIEQTGSSNGRCDCCGTTTNRVWGFVRREGAPVAAWFTGWTEGRPEHGAAFDLILGEWGDDAPKEARFAVALDYRVIDQKGEFMVVDAEGRADQNHILAATALK